MPEVDVLYMDFNSEIYESSLNFDGSVPSEPHIGYHLCCRLAVI